MNRVVQSKGGRSFSWPPFLLLLISLAAFAGGVTAESRSKNAANPEVQLKQLRERIDQLQSRMRRTEGQRSELSLQLQTSEQSIGRIARSLRVLQGRLERQQARLQELRQQEQEQSAQLKKEQAMLAQQVRSAYAMGRQEQLRLLLSQQQPEVLTRMLAYYDYLNRERARRMQQIREQLTELADTREEIAAQGRKLKRLEKEQGERKAALEDQQSDRRRVLASLSGELEDHSRQLGRLRQDEKQLGELLQGLQDALADIPTQDRKQLPFSKVRGKVAWPLKGRIEHQFGEVKIGKLRWDGVMIQTPEGREVRAVYPGRVAFADWLRGFGLLLIVDHGEGYMTLYGHNQSLFKEAGDWVEEGESVAAAGSTGGQRRSGVYFAIRRHGKPIDPRKWCRQTKGKKVG